jgi:hypothetical protein
VVFIVVLLYYGQHARNMQENTAVYSAQYFTKKPAACRCTAGALHGEVRPKPRWLTATKETRAVCALRLPPMI